ncbi:MAG: hypothetical protein E6J61_19130 [Deltaproteobacteria bacterium]|nr:MAG: hypothetical protein E6J61_19130 [Deltaproteobacteria bacterium]
MMRATRGGMMSSGSEDAGQGAQGNGASDSTDALLPLLYQELKAIARRERLRLSGGETLATTALLHEAYARLAPAHGFPSRGQFLASAAVTMRRILIDRVRAQLAAKRGAGAEQVGLDEAADFVVEDGATVLGVHDRIHSGARTRPRSKPASGWCSRGSRRRRRAGALAATGTTLSISPAMGFVSCSASPCRMSFDH